MSPVGLALAAVLVAFPLAGRLLAPPAEVLPPRRSLVRHALHLGAVAATILLALEGARPRAARLDWDLSTVVAVLLGGLAWTEGVLLSFGRLPGRAAPGALDDRRDDGRESDSGLGAWTGAHTSGAGEEPELEREEGVLSAEGEALLSRMERLDRVPVSSIMTPREKIITVDAEDSLASVLERMRRHGRTRLVVTSGTLDRILGVVHAKDLVPLVYRTDRPTILRRHLRRALRVPVDQPVAGLLEEFRRHRVHVGVVSDRLGRTLGLVTMTDVYRSIAGAEAPADPGDTALAGERP